MTGRSSTFPEAQQYAQKSTGELIKNADEVWEKSEGSLPEDVRAELGAVFHGMVIALSTSVEKQART